MKRTRIPQGRLTRKFLNISEATRYPPTQKLSDAPLPALHPKPNFMFHFSLVFCLLTSIFAGLPRQELETSVRPFPASSALAEGVSPEALDVLDQLVQGFVDENEIVGAELMVIVNGSSILHQAYGIRDVETESPMETGSVFCVRSMTKPLIGTAIWMLLEEKRFKLNDSISKYLPAFDVEGSKDITIKHLLTHTSGLPMSQIFNADLSKLNEQGGIQAVAELGAGIELGFTPGSAFNYSDQGTDTLTALIEVVTGESATSFIEERILTPLSMKMSACVMTEG
ncbi:MAG: CubicO group peptidase (beta-lactamase class C family), partial [Planctomycetota bacterium]